jgi:hypothetical protein
MCGWCEMEGVYGQTLRCLTAGGNGQGGGEEAEIGRRLELENEI